MRATLWMILVVATPGLWFIAQCEVLRWVCEGEAPRALRPLARAASRAVGSLRRRRDEEPLPTVLLALELRRLGAEVRRIEESGQPHRAARLAAALAAYDHVLLQLCRHADVPAPGGRPPLAARTRLDLEAELVATGVDW